VVLLIKVSRSVLLSVTANSSNDFKFGNLQFKSPINVSAGTPDVWLGAFNIGASKVYHTELDSDITDAVQVTGTLVEREILEGITWKGNSQVSLFCRLTGIEGGCKVDDLSSWNVVYGNLAEDYVLQGVRLLADDFVYLQPTIKRHRLLAFRSNDQFRPVELVHENLEIRATVQARAVIFNEKGFTTAIYTKEGEKLFGVPLQERQTFSAASIEIHPSGEIHLSPQRGISTMVDGFPLGVSRFESFALLKFLPDGQMARGVTLGEFKKGGILFRGNTTVEIKEDQFTVQLHHGGDNYEGVWAGENVFLYRAKFTFSSSEKVIDLVGENNVSRVNYVENMRNNDRVLKFNIQ